MQHFLLFSLNAHISWSHWLFLSHGRWIENNIKERFLNSKQALQPLRFQSSVTTGLGNNILGLHYLGGVEHKLPKRCQEYS